MYFVDNFCFDIARACAFGLVNSFPIRGVKLAQKTIKT